MGRKDWGAVNLFSPQKMQNQLYQLSHLPDRDSNVSEEKETHFGRQYDANRTTYERDGVILGSETVYTGQTTTELSPTRNLILYGVDTSGTTTEVGVTVYTQQRREILVYTQRTALPPEEKENELDILSRVRRGGQVPFSAPIVSVRRPVFDTYDFAQTFGILHSKEIALPLSNHWC